jgi:hypothetical protein
MERDVFISLLRDTHKTSFLRGIVIHTIIPALRRLKQKDDEFEASLGYIARLSQKTQRNKKTKQQQQKNPHSLSDSVLISFTKTT